MHGVKRHKAVTRSKANNESDFYLGGGNFYRKNIAINALPYAFDGSKQKTLLGGRVFEFGETIKRVYGFKALILLR